MQGCRGGHAAGQADQWVDRRVTGGCECVREGGMADRSCAASNAPQCCASIGTPLLDTPTKLTAKMMRDNGHVCGVK